MNLRKALKSKPMAIYRIFKSRGQHILVYYIPVSTNMHMYNIDTGKYRKEVSKKDYHMGKYQDWVLFYDYPRHLPDEQRYHFLRKKYYKLNPSPSN